MSMCEWVGWVNRSFILFFVIQQWGCDVAYPDKSWRLDTLIRCVYLFLLVMHGVYEEKSYTSRGMIDLVSDLFSGM